MSSKFVFRPVQESDIPAILEVVGKAGPGFNFWSNDAEHMKRKIRRAIDSFAEKKEITDRTYLFILENLENQDFMGTAAIEAFVGGHTWPFYKYKLTTLVQISRVINQSRKHQLLNLVTDHEGTSELGALYLKPIYRGNGRGTFLSRARCLFIAEFANLFSDRIIADMRGVSDNNALSPFWEALGQPFFNMSYEDATYLKATQGSQFLVDLAPRNGIYVDLLPEVARNVIGKTHKDTTPALQVLEKEGFLYQNYIDIFDAGPTIEVSRNHLRTVKESISARLVACKEKISEGSLMLIGNTQLNIRATLGLVEVPGVGEVVLEADIANRIKVSVGDRIRYCHF